MRKLSILLILIFILTNTAWATPKPGDQAPKFSLVSMEGKTVSLDDLKGKIVLMGMFHICVPCMNQAMEFEKVKAAVNSDNLVVLGINTNGDSKEGVEKYLSGFPSPISFTYLLDPEMSVQKAYIQRDMPTILIIDQKGEIKARSPSVGADQLVSYIKTLL